MPNTSTGAFILFFWQIHPKGAFIWHTVVVAFRRKIEVCLFFLTKVLLFGRCLYLAHRSIEPTPNFLQMLPIVSPQTDYGHTKVKFTFSAKYR